MKFSDWILKQWHYIVFVLVLIAFYMASFGGYLNGKQNEALKEYKDGIQNHLVFNTKGECFFVRPNDEVTVYLVRVSDCDKK